MSFFPPQPKGEVHKQHRLVTLEGGLLCKETTITVKSVIYQPITEQQEGQLQIHTDQPTSAFCTTRLQDMNLESTSNLLEDNAAPLVLNHNFQDEATDTSPKPVKKTSYLPNDFLGFSPIKNRVTPTTDLLQDTDTFMDDEYKSADFAALDSFELFPDITPTTTTVSSESDTDSGTDIDTDNHSCKEVDETIGEHDVIAQRGGLSNKHSGTKAYRVKGINMRSKYQSAPSKIHKTKISQSLVHWVHQKGGRFVKKNIITGEWRVMSDKEARIKTAQFLRTRTTS